MRRILLAWLLSVCSFAWASFPATSTPNVTTYYYNPATDALNFTSLAGLIAHYISSQPGYIVCGAWTATPKTSCPGIVPTVRDSWTYNVPIYRFYASNGGYFDGGTQIWYEGADTILSCPANATLSDGQCTCQAGYNESSNSCVPDAPPFCPAGRSAAQYTYTTTSGAGPMFFQEDGTRCVLERDWVFCTGGDDGLMHCVAETKLTGEYCPPAGCDGDGSDGSPSAPPVTDPSIPDNTGPCQPGYYYGTVNGQTVCVPGHGSESTKTTSTTSTTPAGTVEKSQTTVTTTGTSPNGTQTTQTTQTTLEQQWSAARQITHQSESSYPSSAIPANTGETKTTTVTNPDGSKTEYTLTKNDDGTVSGTERDQNTVEKTETTTCTGSSCTVSSTTNTNGQQTGSTTGTTDKAGLCEESPNNPQCGDGDGGLFQGTCTAGFQCEGDAVQCAMAKKQHEAACAFLENKSPESELYDAEKNKPGNVTGDNPNNSTEVIGSGMFDYSSATGGGSCIPNKTITVMGQSIDLPFSNICTWLEVLGNVLVSVSSLIALRIVMRG